MRSFRVLVVDDNEDHLFLTAHALRAAGAGIAVQTVGVRDGREALDHLHGRGEHAGRVLPDLILLDLSLPRMSGLDVLGAIKRDADLAYIPVVVLTSSVRPEDIRSAYAAGANSYVTKAQDLDVLVAYWSSTVILPPHG